MNIYIYEDCILLREEIDKYAPAVVNKILVATKTDLVSKRVAPCLDQSLSVEDLQSRLFSWIF